MKVISIEGFNHYLIDESGNVYLTKNRHGNLLNTPKLKVLTKIKTGYLQAILKSDNKKIKAFYAHRLVAQHYIPNPGNLPCVCHKDDNPANNHVSNLFWGTHRDNIIDMINKGRCKKAKPKVKKERPKFTRGKTVLQFSKQGELIGEFISAREVKRNLNIYPGPCLQGRSQTSGGFIWKRKHER